MGERFKLIQAPHPELYDLREDPGEKENLIGKRDDEAEAARHLLTEIISRQLPPLAAEERELPDPKDRIQEQNLLHRAMLAEEDARLEDARGLFEKVVQLDAGSWTALGQLGRLEMQAGYYANASEHLKAARKLRPQDASLAMDEGRARANSGDLPGAREALESSLHLDAQQFSARAMLGKTCLKLKDLECAADNFDAALLLEPESVEAQLGLAEAEIGQRNYADAAEQLRHLIQGQPKNADALELLAGAYRGLHKISAAEQAEREARSIRTAQTNRK